MASDRTATTRRVHLMTRVSRGAVRVTTQSSNAKRATYKLLALNSIQKTRFDRRTTILKNAETTVTIASAKVRSRATLL